MKEPCCIIVLTFKQHYTHNSDYGMLTTGNNKPNNLGKCNGKFIHQILHLIVQQQTIQAHILRFANIYENIRIKLPGNHLQFFFSNETQIITPKTKFSENE